MKRRSRLNQTRCLFLLCLLVGCGGRDFERPNVVLISIDTLRADHLGVHGYERPTSPFIDSLAESSVVLLRAFSQSPKTAPSHMSLLTGLYPDAHGVRNFNETSNTRLHPNVPTLASLFKQSGYRTEGHTGGGNVSKDLGFDQGFDVYDDSGNVSEIFARARSVIQTQSETPFFLFVHSYVVHDPYMPPDEYRQGLVDPDYQGGILSTEKDIYAAGATGWADFQRVFWESVDQESEADRVHLTQLYDASIRYADDMVKELYEALEKAGLTDNTIFVVTSDHGEEFLEHDRFKHSSMYEEVLHVPLIYHIPGADIEPRTMTGIASQIDLAPTILDLAGLTPPPLLQGKSLLPYLRGEPMPDREVWSRWPNSRQQSFRLDRWKLIQRFIGRDKVEELYDLAADPGETRNIIDPQTEVRQKIWRWLRQLRQGSNAINDSFGTGEQVTLDQEARDELKALGYLGGDN